MPPSFPALPAPLKMIAVAILLMGATSAWRDQMPPTPGCTFQATPQSSCIRGCIRGLKRIDDAKEEWALDKHKDVGAFVKISDLYPAYLKELPKCPLGGSYAIRAIGTDPICTVDGHALP